MTRKKMTNQCQLKRIIRACETPREQKLVASVVKAMIKFYREHLWEYRARKKVLAEAVPPEMLTLIQQTVDYQVKLWLWDENLCSE